MTGWRREAALTAGVGLGAVLFCVGLLGAAPSYFLRDDAQIAAVPVWYEVLRAVREGSWPLLTPYAWNTPSLAGEYQVGVFSPLVIPGMLLATALAPTMAAAGAVFACWNAFWAATGAFRLARTEGLPVALAVMTAFVATFNGWNMEWAIAVWIPAMHGFAGMMWAWWGLAALVKPDARPWRLAAAAAGVFLLITAGWPHYLFASVAFTAWLGLRAGFRRRSAGPMAALALAWVLGTAMATPAWLSFLDFLAHTFRAGANELQWGWVVPPLALAGLFAPGFVTSWSVFQRDMGHISLELANGLAVPAALVALLATARGEAVRRWRWELGLAAAFLALALLPGFGMFRWTFRWLPPFHVAAALLAGHWLAARRRTGEGPNPGLVALAGAGPLLPVIVAQGIVSPLPAGLGVVLAALWAWLEGGPAGRPAGRPGGGADARSRLRRAFPAAMTVASLFAAAALLPHAVTVPFYQLGEAVRAPGPFDPARRYFTIAAGEDYFGDSGVRPDWGTLIRPGNTAMLAGLEFLNGYTPLAPIGPALAFSNEIHGYLRPPAIEAILARGLGPTDLLARLGVDGLVLGPSLRAGAPRAEAAGWTVVRRSPDGVLLHRAAPVRWRALSYGAARVVDAGDLDARSTRLYDGSGVPTVLVPKGGAEPLLPAAPPGGVVRAFAPRRLSGLETGRLGSAVDVAPGPGTGLVAVLRPWVPGMAATLDGRPVPVVVVDNLVPGVVLPDGAGGRLAIRYRPRALTLGLPLAGGTALLLIALTLWRERRRPRPPESPQPEPA